MDNVQPLMTDPTPSAEAEALAGQLLDRMALDASGMPFDDSDPQTWAEAEATETELVSLRSVRFKVIDAYALDLARAVGAIEPGDGTATCWKVEFDAAEGAPVPRDRAGRPPADRNARRDAAVCRVGDPCRLQRRGRPGPRPGRRNPEFDMLKFNQALLVLVETEDVL